MYKRMLFLLLLIPVLLLPMVVQAVGVGVILGEPTGLSLSFGRFPVLGIAWSIDNFLHLHIDYWLINEKLGGPTLWYFGLGGQLGLMGSYGDKENGFGLAARFPLGLQWWLSKRFELFVEAVPGFQILPATGFAWDAGLGLRYHF